MRYYEIIKEGYKEVQQKYITAGIDPESVEKTFNTYKELVNRNQVSGNERNIDWWGKQSFDQFKSFVDEKSSEKSTTQVKRSKIPGKSINLVDNENWHIVIPLDKDASCFHGKNSDWCTAKPNQSYFEQYFYDKEIILIYCKNNNGGMWAIAAHKDTDVIEMFDQNDRSMEEEEFNSETGLDVDKIVSEALKHQSKISLSRNVYKEARARIKEYFKSGVVGRNAQIEKDLILTKKGDLCYQYMKKVNSKEDYPLSIQLSAVKQDTRAIQYIDNPSEKLQLAAVTKDGNAIQYVDNPSEQVQIAAVTKNVDAIHHIKNPSEQVQLAAVTRDGEAMYYIITMGIIPSEAVQLAAVTQNFSSIVLIKNPSKAVQLASEKVHLAAVTRDGYLIQFIENPSEELQLAAVTQNGHAIEGIDNPSEQVKLAAVTQNGEAIEHIYNRSEAVKLAAVSQNGNAIEFINNPSEELQLAAVTQNGEAIYHLNNPSDAVKKAAGL